MVFVNQKAELLDTRSSPPAYSKIDPNCNYPKYYYDFTSSKSIETYWNDAIRFCIDTKLGEFSLLCT